MEAFVTVLFLSLAVCRLSETVLPRLSDLAFSADRDSAGCDFPDRPSALDLLAVPPASFFGRVSFYFCLCLFRSLSASRKGFGLLVPLGSRRYRPCTCGLSTSSSLTALYGDLILRGASCLDAFSTYPGQTRLPGGAPGGTTGTPVVCPTRSSRTSVGASQISCAHNR